MVERDLALRRPGSNASVEAVEALEPGAGVVVAVGARPVADTRPGELDLVRRVVDVEPGSCRLPEADLERHGRKDECRRDREGGRCQDPRPPGANGERHECEDGDAAARQHRDRAEEADVPPLVGEPDEEGERTARLDVPGPEAPRIRPERADVQQDGGGECSEDDPGVLARDESRAAHGEVVRAPANAARSPFRER